MKPVNKIAIEIFTIIVFNYPYVGLQVDPQLRFLLELSYEALVDAGFTDLKSLRGSKTAVYVGSCFSDCHKGWLNDVKDITGYENTGCAQSMYANRLSFFYDFAGAYI